MAYLGCGIPRSFLVSSRSEQKPYTHDFVHLDLVPSHLDMVSLILFVSDLVAFELTVVGRSPILGPAEFNLEGKYLMIIRVEAMYAADLRPEHRMVARRDLVHRSQQINERI